MDKFKDALGVLAGIAFFALIISGLIWLGGSSDNTQQQPHDQVQAAASQSSQEDSSSSYSGDFADSSSNYDDSSDEDCNPNYDPCVENSDYDLDCADVGQQVTVIGDDPYNLDGDGDGVGCESY